MPYRCCIQERQIGNNDEGCILMVVDICFGFFYLVSIVAIAAIVSIASIVSIVLLFGVFGCVRR